jgi:hypothetical protein
LLACRKAWPEHNILDFAGSAALWTFYLDSDLLEFCHIKICPPIPGAGTEVGATPFFQKLHCTVLHRLKVKS